MNAQLSRHVPGSGTRQGEQAKPEQRDHDPDRDRRRRIGGQLDAEVRLATAAGATVRPQPLPVGPAALRYRP